MESLPFRGVSILQMEDNMLLHDRPISIAGRLCDIRLPWLPGETDSRRLSPLAKRKGDRVKGAHVDRTGS